MTKRTPLTDAEVIAAIEANQGSVARAADALGVTAQAIYKRLDDRGLVIEVEKVTVRQKEAA
jgi:transcriptional regulator of acetoin/glycerol metabolism